MNRSNFSARRWTAHLLWILGLVLVLGIGGGLALRVLLPPERLRAMVTRELSTVLARDVRFGRVSAHIFPPIRLTVDSVAIAQPGGFAYGNVVTLGSLSLDMDALAYFTRHEFLVHRVGLENPDIYVRMNPDGSTSLDGMIRPGPPGHPGHAPMDIRLDALDVSNGHARIDDFKAGRQMALGWRTHTSFGTSPARDLMTTSGSTAIHDLQLGALHVMTGFVPAPTDSSLSSLTWRLDHRGRYQPLTHHLDLDRMDVRMGRASLAASGHVDSVGPRPILDLHVQGSDVDLGQLMGFLADINASALHGVRGTGRAAFDIALRGQMAAARLPPIEGTIGVTQATLRYPRSPVPIEGLSFTALLAPDSLRVSDLRARVAGQPLTGRISVVRFADPYVDFSLRGNVELAAVAPLVAPGADRLTGVATVDVSGHGPLKDPGAIALSGVAGLRNGTLHSPTLPRPYEAIQGTFRFSAAKASVQGFSARAGGSSFALDASVARPLALTAKRPGVPPAVLSFRLSSPNMNLDEMVPGGGEQHTTLPNLVGSGLISVGRLRQARLDLSNVTATVRIPQPGLIDVTGFAAQGYQGSIDGVAHVDLRRPALPQYAVRARIQNADANSFLSTWSPARDWVHATVSTSMDLTAVAGSPQELRRSLTAQGLAALSQGTVGPGPALDRLAERTHIPALRMLRFGAMRLPFRIVGGRVITDSIRIAGPQGDWLASGSIGLDGTLDYAVSMTLPAAVVARLGAMPALAAGALQDDQGRMLIDLRITGTAHAPQVSWDPAAARDRLMGRVSRALAEQTNKLQEQVTQALVQQQGGVEDSVRNAAQQFLPGVFRSLVPARPHAPTAPADTMAGKMPQQRPVAPAPDTARARAPHVAAPDTARKHPSPATTPAVTPAPPKPAVPDTTRKRAAPDTMRK